MTTQKQQYKPVQISPEYHRKLSFFALDRGLSKKQVVEDMLDAALQKINHELKPQDEVVYDIRGNS